MAGAASIIPRLYCENTILHRCFVYKMSLSYLKSTLSTLETGSYRNSFLPCRMLSSRNKTVVRKKYFRSRGSSVGIVSDYGLDDRVIEVRSSTGAEDFSSSPCVQTGSEAHPASYPMGTGGPFPGGKARPGRDADHSPPSSGRG
jgi:hypothetical protein